LAGPRSDLPNRPIQEEVRSAGLRANLGHLGNPRLPAWTCGRAATGAAGGRAGPAGCHGRL